MDIDDDCCCSKKYAPSLRISNRPRRPLVESQVTLYCSGLLLMRCNIASLDLLDVSTCGFNGNVVIEAESDDVIWDNTVSAREYRGESVGTGSSIPCGKLG